MRITGSLALIALAATPAIAQRPGNATNATNAANDAIRIPFETYKLANGLTVVLSPNQATPTVAVDVWYHVGSKNEVPGRTGFAHMFEHVMFTGSGNVAYGLHDRYTQGVGGNNNGSTTEDRTNYYETIPSNYLETALWLESDRMGFLLDKLDSAKFIAQRDIVQNERREYVENQPYGRSFEIMNYAMYPEDHPYRWPTSGYMTDLQNATVDDVKSFFRLYYAPTNATLAIVGDFEPTQAKQWVAKYFGDLPKGAAITRPKASPPTVTSERRLVYEDRVQIPNLFVMWPTVGMKEDDTYAINVLSRIMAGSRTSRLTKALVYDRQSAATVNAYAIANADAGSLLLEIVPRPGHTLTQLEAVTDSVVLRLKNEGPSSDELARALAGIEFAFVSGLQSNLGKAEILNNGAVFFNDPSQYRTRYARMKAVTAADVKRVANTYLGPGRVVLSVVPEGKIDQASKPESSRKVSVAPDGGHYVTESKS